MKHLLIAFLTVVTLSVTAQKVFQTQELKMEVNNKGKITSLYGDKEYLPASAESYLLRANIAGEDYLPISVKWKGNTATATFANDVKVVVKATKANNYLKFEVVKLENEAQIDVLFWGPFATSISETIGEYVGVVRNGSYSLGYQSLNAKTTGGKKLFGQGDSSVPAGWKVYQCPHRGSLTTSCSER